MSLRTNIPGTADRRLAAAPLPENAALELALAVHGIPTPQIRKLVRLAVAQPSEDRAAALARALAQLYLFNPLGDAVGRFFFVGAPGVGKSTLIDALGSLLTRSGRKVAVLAVDPSSRRTGGSILADKTRMAQLANEGNAFIRPSPTSGTLTSCQELPSQRSIICCRFFGL